MRIENLNRKKQITLNPGDRYAGKAVGVNHFLLSTEVNNNMVPPYISDAGRYGVCNGTGDKRHVKTGGKTKIFESKSVRRVEYSSSEFENGSYITVGDSNVGFMREFTWTTKKSHRWFSASFHAAAVGTTVLLLKKSLTQLIGEITHGNRFQTTDCFNS